MITVQDIHEKEFKRKMRGYDELEVDEFLDRIAEDYARLQKEAQDLREMSQRQISTQQAAVAAADENVKTLEKSLRDTLVLAQRTADETVEEAQKKSKLIIQSAEDRIALLEYDAKKRIEALETTIHDLQEKAAGYRAQLRKLAQAQIEMLDDLERAPRAAAELSAVSLFDEEAEEEAGTEITPFPAANDAEE